MHSVKPIIIRTQRQGLTDSLQELWEYRDLLWLLTVRQVSVRYKQTVIGVAWVLLQPLVAMAIFTVIFGYFAKLSSNGLSRRGNLTDLMSHDLSDDTDTAVAMVVALAREGRIYLGEMYGNRERRINFDKVRNSGAMKAMRTTVAVQAERQMLDAMPRRAEARRSLWSRLTE